MSDEIRTEPETISAPTSKPHSQHVDKFAARRAEIKKHKRKAHRRKINASNRPG